MDDIRDIPTSNTGQSSQGNQNANNGTSGNSGMYGSGGMYGNSGMYGSGGMYDRYGQAPDPQFDTFPAVPIKKKKISFASVIVIVIFLAVLTFAAIFLMPPYIAARKFGKAYVVDKNVKKVCEVTFPEKFIEKGDIMYEYFCEKLKWDMDAICDGKLKGIKMGKTLKPSDLRKIETYFEYMYKLDSIDGEVKIMKGYECEIRFKFKETDFYFDCCVFKMKGEGWLVFPDSIDEIDAVNYMIEDIID